MSDSGNDDFLPSDDPQYRDLQALYFEQLTTAEKRLQEELQESELNKKSVQREKEEIGVRLYTAQQQLAANQTDYEKAHDNFNIAQRLRVESEQKLTQINEAYVAKKEEVTLLKSKVEKSQKELENLMRHYHEIENYNIQLKSDIAVTKIETFTAEQNVTNLEKIKKKQDELIDSMNEEAKRLEEQKNILAAQIISQKEETEEAKKILREAQVEMEKVVATKRTLLDKWQKSLLVMQKRDSMVQTLRERLHEENEKRMLLLNQLSGLKTEIRKEQEQTEKLGAQSNLLEKQKAALELAQTNLLHTKSRISEQLMLLKESLARTEGDIYNANLQQRSVEEAMNLIQGNIMKLHTESKRLIDKLFEQKSEHTTYEKTAYNLLKQAHKAVLDTEEKQIELENIQNEIARVKLDQLNTKSQLEHLEQCKKIEEMEQNEKRYLVITYEVQIRQGHDINEKKQHEVGRLNKIHDELMSKANDEGKNPLENKLMNLTRETETLESECTELYREWIKKQTVLVHENNRLQELREKVSQLDNKKTIMEQKKVRLNSNYHSFEREIFEIKTSLKGLQQEMNKLNDNIAVNNDKRAKIENEKINLESEFAEKLKEMQAEAIRMEISIDKIREEKAELMNEIVECERQILLWERKYQLQKQMQDALDPNVGQSEIEELKKELHRMELKYSSLLKEQDKTNTEMLRAATKRVDIEQKYGALNTKKETVKSKQPSTYNQIKHALKKAQENKARTLKSLQETEGMLAKKEQELEQVTQSVEATSQELQRLEVNTHQLETQRVLARMRKNVDVLKIASLQKKYKKLEEITNKTAKLMYQEPVLRDRVEELKGKNHLIYQSLEEMAQRYSQYNGLIVPLLETSVITYAL